MFQKIVYISPDEKGVERACPDPECSEGEGMERGNPSIPFHIDKVSSPTPEAGFRFASLTDLSAVGTGRRLRLTVN